MANNLNPSRKIILIGAGLLLILGIIIAGLFLWLPREPAQEPKTYTEIFEEPIDPQAEPARHQEVYQKIQDIAHFKIKYPQEMPSGYHLTKVEATEGERIERGKYYGLNITTYENEKGQKLQILQGIADLGAIIDLKKNIPLPNNFQATLWCYRCFEEKCPENNCDSRWLAITLQPKSKPLPADDYGYFLIGENITKEELIEIARFFAEAKEL